MTRARVIEHAPGEWWVLLGDICIGTGATPEDAIEMARAELAGCSDELARALPRPAEITDSRD